jgi:hypothetical protein
MLGIGSIVVDQQQAGPNWTGAFRINPPAKDHDHVDLLIEAAIRLFVALRVAPSTILPISGFILSPTD